LELDYLKYENKLKWEQNLANCTYYKPYLYTTISSQISISPHSHRTNSYSIISTGSIIGTDGENRYIDAIFNFRDPTYVHIFLPALGILYDTPTFE
jgi:hypothetical protein